MHANQIFNLNCLFLHHTEQSIAQSVKVDLNKKFDSKQKTIQIFNTDAQGLRKTKNENPPTWERGVTIHG